MSKPVTCPQCGGKAYYETSHCNGKYSSVAYCEKCFLEIRSNTRVPVVPQWTTEPPKEEGYYWIKRESFPVMVLLVFLKANDWFVRYPGAEIKVSELANTLWCRIEEPLPEKGEPQ